MNTREKAELMLWSLEEGNEVEWSPYPTDASTWDVTGAPSWDWTDLRYRKKATCPDLWVNMPPSGGGIAYLTRSEAIYEATHRLDKVAVKYVVADL